MNPNTALKSAPPSKPSLRLPGAPYPQDAAAAAAGPPWGQVEGKRRLRGAERPLFDGAIVRRAIGDSFREHDRIRLPGVEKASLSESRMKKSRTASRRCRRDRAMRYSRSFESEGCGVVATQTIDGLTMVVFPLEPRPGVAIGTTLPLMNLKNVPPGAFKW